jgi:hypothetical protein
MREMVPSAETTLLKMQMRCRSKQTAAASIAPGWELDRLMIDVTLDGW